MENYDEMKILFYCGGFAPIGGIETLAKNLLSYLKAKHHSCTLLCWGQKSPLFKSIQEVRVTTIRSPWRWGCKWNVPDWILLPTGLKQIQQADVVLFGKLFPLQLLKQIRVQAGARKCLVFITPYQPISPEHTVEKIHLLEALNIFDLIIVQSSSFVDDLHNIGYKGQIEVIPYIPHNYSTIQPFPLKEKLKLGFLGRLVEDKNLPLLLTAFRIFCNKYLENFSFSEQPSLHIFGDGHLRQQLENLVQKLDIKSNVIFHGGILNSQVEDAIASCHLFAFTSRIEGQCLAALEILSCGRPIVATNAGALPDILSDSRLGRLVNANPEDFAHHLIEIVKSIHEQSITPEIIRAAYLERYEPKRVGERYLEILKSLT